MAMMRNTATSPSAGSWGLISHYDKSKGRMTAPCTETLGSESSRDDVDYMPICVEETTDIKPLFVEKELEVEKVKEISTTSRQFPPVLHTVMVGCDSLCKHGVAMTKDFSYMRSVKKNGRLVLTEVTVDKPERLRATRKNGNLRLNQMSCHVEKNINEDENTLQTKNPRGKSKWLFLKEETKKMEWRKIILDGHRDFIQK